MSEVRLAEKLPKLTTDTTPQIQEGQEHQAGYMQTQIQRVNLERKKSQKKENAFSIR